MATRKRYAPRERSARSRLAQLLHDHEVICGSVVSMARRCGKSGCRCEQGEKHVSLYLSAKIKGKRRMVYIPAQLEAEVRRCVDAYREVQDLTQRVSEACVARLLDKKESTKEKKNG